MAPVGAGGAPAFATSTHAQYWLLTEPGIKALREEVQNQCVKKGADPNHAYPTRQVSLQRFLIRRLMRICADARVQAKVMFTACTYIRRFMLMALPTQYCLDPDVLLCALYVACKVDEQYLSAETVSSLRGGNESTLLGLELEFMRLISFDLIVFDPFRPLAAFLDEEVVQDVDEGLSAKFLQDARQEGKCFLYSVIPTDVFTLESPGAVALVALRAGLAAAVEASDVEYLGADALFLAIVRQATGLGDTAAQVLCKKVSGLQVRIQHAIHVASPSQAEDDAAAADILQAVTIIA